MDAPCDSVGVNVSLIKFSSAPQIHKNKAKFIVAASRIAARRTGESKKRRYSFKEIKSFLHLASKLAMDNNVYEKIISLLYGRYIWQG